MLNDNFAIKNESRYAFGPLGFIWTTLERTKHSDFNKPYGDFILLDGKKYKKGSKDYNFIEDFRKRKIKFIKECDFPKEIKKKWLNFYKLENVSLESYLEMLEMLKGEPFFWNEESLKIDPSKFSGKNFLNKLTKFHFQVLMNKMYKELWTKERLIKSDSMSEFANLFRVWKFLKETNLDDIKENFPEKIKYKRKTILKNTKEYNDLLEHKDFLIFRNKNKKIPQKRKWFSVYKLKNINLKNYLKIIEILKNDGWDEKIFEFDVTKIDEKNFLKTLKPIHYKIFKKMQDEFYK